MDNDEKLSVCIKREAFVNRKEYKNFRSMY